MKRMARVVVACLAAIGACAALSNGALAQTYPTKPIRIIAPYVPGGSIDLVARILAPSMTKELGQQVIVDNKAGAGGTIGTEYVKNAAPDGYTLLFNQNSMTVNPTLMPDLVHYDPVKDFAPISKIASYMFYLVAHPSLGVHSVKELIALAKKTPGGITCATVGVGSGTHLSAEYFAHEAGITITPVHYKGQGAVDIDILGGHVKLTFGSTMVVPLVKSGKLIGLGVTGLQRSPQLPNLPTIAESGLPGFEVTAWNAFYAPAGTPAAIVNRLNAVLKKGLQLPEVKAVMDKQDLEATPSTPAELGALVKSELAKWAQVIKIANIKAN
jgi:tripartite-type tricarboxylate transporter receptor subunit TctC